MSELPDNWESLDPPSLVSLIEGLAAEVETWRDSAAAKRTYLQKAGREIRWLRSENRRLRGLELLDLASQAQQVEELTDEVETLRAENERLRNALEGNNSQLP